MIQPLYNPFKQTQQILFPQFQKQVLYHYNPKSQTFSNDVKGWQDSYNPANEFNQYQLSLLKGDDWEQYLKGQKEYSSNELSLSIFSSPFTLAQYIQIYVYLTKSTQIEIKQTDQDYSRILKDVNRTFKINPFFQEVENQEALKEILIQYHTVDPELGYSQGMNFIAATILYIFSFHKLNREQIFQIFHFIMIDREWRFMFLDSTPGLFQCLAKLNFKLKKNLPELQKHIQEMGIVKLIWGFASLTTTQQYYFRVLQWNSGYQSQVCLSFVRNINYFHYLEGDSILHKLIIAMMRLFSPKIFKLKSFEEIVHFIKKDMIREFYEQLQLARSKKEFVPFLVNLRLVKSQKLLSKRQRLMNTIITKPKQIGSSLLNILKKKNTNNNTQ